MRKRKALNIIVSGVPEHHTIGEDSSWLENVCLNNLDFIPELNKDKMYRIGKVSSDGPRKLLITLKNNEEKSKLLLRAPALRRSCDPYISKKLFFSQDLTRAEAEYAFKKRVERRAKASVQRPATRRELSTTHELPTGEITVSQLDAAIRLNALAANFTPLAGGIVVPGVVTTASNLDGDCSDANRSILLPANCPGVTTSNHLDVTPRESLGAAAATGDPKP